MELRLEHLVKDFSGTKAVNDVSITIQDGKLTGLLGPSGCGKSTTLYLISGLESPTSGRIFFGDRDVTALPPEKRGIGLVFQNYALYPHLTVEQNIAFPLVNHKEGKEEIRRRTLEMARLVQIEDLLKRKPGQLSGGQQQRVAIARALVKRPDILLLDEPLSNLDARLRLEMREEIRRIQTETGVTTVFVTHDQEEAMSITDEIVLMRTGVVQQQCPPQQMYLNPANRFVAGFLGNPPINFFRLDVCGGTMCLAEDYMLRVHGAADGPVLVGIRPEAWRLGQGLRTAAEAVEMRGKDLLVTFSLAGERARAILDITAGVAAGDAVELTLEPRLVYIFDPETGVYGALGHGVAGLTSAQPLAISGGVLVPSSVTDVKKGVRGTPGELHGSFDVADPLGSVSQNEPHGIFGKLTALPQSESVPVADASQIHTGAAVILANVDGAETREYCVRIDKLYPQAENGRNLLLTVTDERLLSITGGIVQGMSGSPILQDGKLVGAVTHVLVNDPTRGYGILAENMVSQCVWEEQAQVS